MEDKLNEMGDVVIATEVMRATGLSGDHLQDGYTLNKLKDVLDYLKGVPDKMFFVEKATRNKNGNKLDMLWSYVALHKDKDGVLKKMKDLEEQIKLYER